MSVHKIAAIRLYLMCQVLLAWGPAVWSAERGQLEAGYVNPGHVEQPDWFRLSFLDLREDVAEAAATGKRLMLYFYQDGCPYCKKLIEDNFADREIVRLTREHFEVIAINMWGDREVVGLQGQTLSEKAFAAEQRVMFTPTLVMLDEQGQQAMRINGYYAPDKFRAALRFVGEGHYRKQRFLEFYQAVDAPKASGRLHREAGYLQAPLDLTRRESGRPLAVLFEQKTCTACDELHGQMLAKAETQALLQPYDVALVDRQSTQTLVTPSGARLSARAWVKQMEIQYTPTLVLFSPQGREVLRLEAFFGPFHIQSALEYVSSGAFRREPSFQRYVQERGDRIRADGGAVRFLD